MMHPIEFPWKSSHLYVPPQEAALGGNLMELLHTHSEAGFPRELPSRGPKKIQHS